MIRVSWFMESELEFSQEMEKEKFLGIFSQAKDLPRCVASMLYSPLAPQQRAALLSIENFSPLTMAEVKGMVIPRVREI